MGRLHGLHEIKGVKGQSQHLVCTRSHVSLPSLFWWGVRGWQKREGVAMGRQPTASGRWDQTPAHREGPIEGDQLTEPEG